MVTVLVLTKKHPCDLYIFEMVAFNAKKSKQKSTQLTSRQKKKKDLLVHEDLPGGLRWLSKRPTWKNKGRSGRQI